MKICKEAPAVGKYDVVVCGGGPAGWAAATEAARSGAKTAVLDRFGFFGGTAAAGLVVPISGYFNHGQRAVGGIAWEFENELEKTGSALVELPNGHVSADPEYYKLIAQRMVLQSGADTYTNSYLSGVIKSSETRVSAVIIENKNGTEVLEGKYFVDATGDGDLLAMAGAEMTEADAPQPLSLCFELTGVDTSTPLLKDCIHHNKARSVNTVIHEFLAEENKNGRIASFGGPWFNTLLHGDRLAVNVTRAFASATDNRAYSAAEMQMREDMFAITELLRSKYPEFRSCVISSSAVSAGVRESRHLRGEVTLTGEDLLQGVHFPDSIARNAHPVDIHSSADGGQIVKEMPQAGYIPYRCLVTSALENVIASGRMISADREAHASIRVQATCMATGQAAAAAAVLCCRAGVPFTGADVPALQAKLASEGCIF